MSRFAIAAFAKDADCMTAMGKRGLSHMDLHTGIQSPILTR